MAQLLGLALESPCNGLQSHFLPPSQRSPFTHLNSSYDCGLGFPEARHRQGGTVGAGSGKEPELLHYSPFLPSLCRAMSHQTLLLLAVLTWGLATSQHRDKVLCKMVRNPAQEG